MQAGRQACMDGWMAHAHMFCQLCRTLSMMQRNSRSYCHVEEEPVKLSAAPIIHPQALAVQSLAFELLTALPVVLLALGEG